MVLEEMENFVNFSEVLNLELSQFVCLLFNSENHRGFINHTILKNSQEDGLGWTLRCDACKAATNRTLTGGQI